MTTNGGRGVGWGGGNSLTSQCHHGDVQKMTPYQQLKELSVCQQE